MSPGYLVKFVLNRVMPQRVLLHRYNKVKNGLALTFDDGPHPVNSNKILDCLEKFNAKATFFIQGSEARKYPQLVQRMLRDGHQIGNHGFNHLDCKRTAIKEYVEDVESAQKLLEDIAGHHLRRIFRPPYGSVTMNSFSKLMKLGYAYVFWSADSRDSFIQTPDELLTYTMMLPIKSGEILLFHEDYMHSTEILPSIISNLQRKGFDFQPIDSFF